MAIADKQVMINNLEQTLGDVLTANQIHTVMQTLTEELTHYDVSAVEDDYMPGTDMIAAFIDAKGVEGRSPNTLERYRYIMDRLMSSIKVPLHKVNVYHLRGFLSKEKDRGISDSTLEGYRQVYSSVFGWLHKEGLIPSNPCANLNPIKVAKKVRTPYSEVDMELLKDGCVRCRDKAIVYFLRATGCRISEMCKLNRADVDITLKECKVLGKGNKERTVYYDDVTALMLRRYLDSRSDTDGALFVSVKAKKRLKPGGVRYMLKTIEHASQGALDNVHPHRFRRTFATGMIDAGMPIQDVAAILGHEKIDTTMRYVYQSAENIKAAYQRYSK